MNIWEMTPEIQRRVHGYWKSLPQESFSLPERKFIGEMLLGLLKAPGIYVTGVARSLGENLKLKKTWERLNRNVRREGLWERLTDAHLSQQSVRIRQKRFCVIDMSDVQKAEATQIEGLALVRDGDKSKKGDPVIGSGFNWLNAVMADRDGLLPVYSELYSSDFEQQGENQKIVGIVKKVGDVHPEVVFVVDRAGDRGNLLDAFEELKKRYIIRGMDQRSLGVRRGSSKRYNIGQLARGTKSSMIFKSMRGKTFYVGIRRVYYKEHALYLVVSRRSNGAISWYLTNLEKPRHEVMESVMEGYGLRWRIEEYHRQIKQDYRLENIRLRKYMAIKNMGFFVMLAASFISRLPENLVIKLVSVAKRLNKNKLSDIPRYPYYMITAAVAYCLAAAVKQRPIPLWIRKRDFWQLKFALALE